MNSTEMMERFRRFASAGLFIINLNQMHQVSEVLLKTSTVRIILTRYECRAEDLDVDIEVSLPSLPETSDVTLLQESVDSIIANLEYLKRLASIGFGLDMLQEEGILIASAVLSEDTKEDVFKLLEPPAEE
ncbi:MAG: hypothetical protein ACFFDQ_02955 [Candidatus Thorarchaeota archaeon]